MLGDIEKSWQEALAPLLTSVAWETLQQKVENAYRTTVVYPPAPELFTALHYTPFSHVKVVILGQDPYHDAGQAHGLAFSVPEQCKIPPSLRNIYREIAADIGIPVTTSGNLIRWATQGVLLLNTCLTVEAHKPGSHHHLGWSLLTDTIINVLDAEKKHVVFLLWGNQAIQKQLLINHQKHCVLTAAHPSPLSAHRGFIGCRHFSQCNDYLTQHGQIPIVW